MDFNKNFNKHDYYTYYNLRRRFLINNPNIFFNQGCKNLQIIPKYATSKNKPYNKTSELTNIQYGILRINNEIDYLYRKKNFLSLQLYNQELKNMQIFGQFWHHIKSIMINKLSRFIHTKYETLKKKINQLLAIQQQNIKCKLKTVLLSSFMNL